MHYTWLCVCSRVQKTQLMRHYWWGKPDRSHAVAGQCWSIVLYWLHFPLISFYEVCAAGEVMCVLGKHTQVAVQACAMSLLCYVGLLQAWGHWLLLLTRRVSGTGPNGTAATVSSHALAHALAEPVRVESLSQESQLNPAVRLYVLPWAQEEIFVVSCQSLND